MPTDTHALQSDRYEHNRGNTDVKQIIRDTSLLTLLCSSAISRLTVERRNYVSPVNQRKQNRIEHFSFRVTVITRTMVWWRC